MRLKILYGSQTGNAQDVAEKVFRYSLNLPKKYFSSSLQEMNYFNFNDVVEDDILIFICSTTGQGDAPDNMKEFWNILMKRSFQKVYFCNFAVFGLGDSKYKKYNFIAKKLFRRLIQLRALPLIPLGLADDQHQFGIDGEFLPWIQSLWKSLNNISETLINNNLFEECSKSVSFRKYDVSILDNSNNHLVEMPVPSQYNTLYLKSNDRVTPNDHFQETRLLTFSKDSLTYNIGDILCIFPRNSDANIDMFFKLTELDRNCVILIGKLDLGFSLPEIFPKLPVTVYELVKHCFDLNCTPRKSFFEVFADLSKNVTEKERLIELSSPSNLDDLYSYCFHPNRRVIEVLQDFPKTSNELNINEWINLIPIIRTREYSIASSPLVHDFDISILVAIVNYKTKMYSQRIGLCSDFLSRLTFNDFAFAKIKKGTLQFPKDHCPIILISPGTGVAAFRGFIAERSNKDIVSETMLCYGCRFKDKDFYFSNEIQKYKDDGKLKLVTAFSREENCYIQNKLKDHSAFIWKVLVELSGYVFLCGRSVDMPQQINEAIKNIFIKEGNLTDEQASNILENMEKLKKYQTETWS